MKLKLCCLTSSIVWLLIKACQRTTGCDNILPMSVFFYANLVFLLCSVTVFVMCLIARAHVVSASKALDTLDWEQTASLTGDMATVKKSIQKLNNRLNGMEAKDPYAVLENLRAQANTGQAIQQTQVKRQGG